MIVGISCAQRTLRLLVRAFYYRLWNQWDFAAANTLLSEDIVFWGSLGVTRQVAGGSSTMPSIRHAFPDFHNTIEDLVGEGDKVVARLTYRGMHRC